MQNFLRFDTEINGGGEYGCVNERSSPFSTILIKIFEINKEKVFGFNHVDGVSASLSCDFKFIMSIVSPLFLFLFYCCLAMVELLLLVLLFAAECV